MSEPLAEDQPLPFNDNAGDPLDEGEAVYLQTERPNVDAANERRLELQAENIELLQGIARTQAQGADIQPPLLFSQLKLRLDMLTDVVLGDGPGRMMYELAYEEQLNAYLNEVTVQVSRWLLTRGVK